MRKNEAYSILELSEDASDDDVKKKFRELSKKWHPDKNLGNPEAEKIFKEINSAYQRITAPSDREKLEDTYGDSHGMPGHGGSMPFGFDFSNFGMNHEIRHTSHVQVSTNISFRESILGCQKEIKYNREIKCKACSGQGHIKIPTDCKKCGGKGQVIQQRGGMVFVSMCECAHRMKANKCKDCKDGVVSTESSVSVTIPGGVRSENVLRLGNMGNYVGSMGSMDQHTDVFLSLNVEKDPDLSLENDTVISNLNISLLEALKGCSKTVKTVLGNKDVVVKPLSKNKEEIIIPHVGVNKKGNQKVILNVSYPNNIEPLIKSLE